MRTPDFPDIAESLAMPEGDRLDSEHVVPFPSPDAPMRVARQLYPHLTDTADARTLLHWRGEWMRWTGAHWEELEQRQLRKQVYAALEGAHYLDESKKIPKVADWNPNRKKIADVLEALQAVAHTSATLDSPCWLDYDPGRPPAAEIVSCRNGLLHVPTRTLMPHTPHFFTLVSVPFDYLADAPAPVHWQEFLDSIWHGDTESTAALQEWTGYVLSGRTDMQKILLLIGPPRSGKGTYARILTALVGRGNAAGPTLASLSTNFGLSPLLGKSVAIVSDARLSGNRNVAEVVERLLSISGEDMLTVDRKFRDPWTGKLPTRFTVLSNELPSFGDASGAIVNRFIPVVMSQSFLGREDTDLTQRLLSELPGILNWALDGLARLGDRGKFTMPTTSAESIRLLADLASPVSAFVRDRCRRDPDAEIKRVHLYDAYCLWAEANGHKRQAASTFGRDLRASAPWIGTGRKRSGEDRATMYFGLDLAPSDLLNPF